MILIESVGDTPFRYSRKIKIFFGKAKQSFKKANALSSKPMELVKIENESYKLQRFYPTFKLHCAKAQSK